MREARAGDVWRNLLRRESPKPWPEVIDLSRHDFVPDSVAISTPVAVIGGLSGAGKTRLLQAVGDELGESARVVNLTVLCNWVAGELTKRTDLLDLRDEAGELEVDPTTRDALEAIVGRNYDDVQWRDIEIAESPFAGIVGDDSCPYIEVGYGGDRYSMANMGLGELSAHILLWLLWHINKSGSVKLLLDEPDAHLPPTARASLLNHLAYVADKAHHSILVTSHSQEFIEGALARPNVLAILTRDAAGVAALSTEDAVVREIALGVLHRRPGVEMVAFVEDEAAAVLLRALLRRIDVDLNLRTEVLWVGGTGPLGTLRSSLPRPSSARGGLRFLFVADGDQLPDEADGKWPLVTLPGECPPDALFKAHCPGQAVMIASRLGRDAQVVSAIFSTIAGKDVHDWTDGFVQLVAVPRQQAMEVLAESMLSSDAGAELVATFQEVLTTTR